MSREELKALAAGVRLHTFKRGDYTLWADRVPAMHGRVNSFTLWQKVGPEHRRILGGVPMPAIRALLARAEQMGDA
jgi:hypothetical protein